MRKHFVPSIILLLTLILAACSPLPSKVDPTTGPKGPQQPTQGGLAVRPPFLDSLQAEIAKQMGVPVDQVVLEELQPAQWSDSCLGLGGPAESCLQVITPGFLLVYSTPNGRLEVHADQTGSSIRKTGEVAQPGDKPVSLTWQRSGGFAGICQRVIVYLDGSFRMMNCVTEAVLAEGQLPEDAAAKISQWRSQYSDFRWELVPPAGTADMFTDTLNFSGSGTAAPDKNQQQLIAEYLAQLSTTLKK